MQVDAQDQIMIPPEVRDRLGLVTRTEVELEVVGEIIQLRKKSKPSLGRQLIEDLRGKASFRETTDEICS